MPGGTQAHEPAMLRLREPARPWTSPGCCLSLEVDGTVVWAPDAVRDIGWAPEQLVGRNVSVVIPTWSSLLGPTDRARVLQGGGAGEDGVTVVDNGVRADGNLFEAAVSVAVKRGPAREMTGLTVVVRDVTTEMDQRRARRMARDRGPVLVLGRDLVIRHATPAGAALLGIDETDVFPRSRGRLLHPNARTAVAEAVERLLTDARRVEQLVVRLRGDDGRLRAVEVTLSNCLQDPDLHGVVATLRDVSDRITADEEARLSAALHRAMVETSEEGIVVTGDDGTTRYVNLATARVLGLPPEQVYAVDLVALLGLQGARAGREEIVYAHPDGIDRILAVTRSPLGDDAALGLLITVADVTESRLSEQDLRRRALCDPLTGLPNRYLVADRLEMAGARQGRVDGGATAVLFIDLDGFKPINDTHGHDAGDELLRQIADRLAAAVRTTDTVGRVGGDEFVVLCEDVDEEATSVVARRVLETLQQPFQLSRATVRIDGSIGIAMSPPHPFDQLLQAADAAMYRAKRAGGGAVVVARV